MLKVTSPVGPTEGTVEGPAEGDTLTVTCPVGPAEGDSLKEGWLEGAKDGVLEGDSDKEGAALGTSESPEGCMDGVAEGS